MKKTTIILLVCLLTALCAGALAESITLVSQNVYACPEYSTSGYGRIYAEIRNDGDAPVKLSKVCDVRYYDKYGNVLTEYKDRSCSPSVLMPGEIGFISEDLFLNAEPSKFGKGELVLHPQVEATDLVVTRTPIIATLDLDELEKTDGDDCYLYAELENNTDELMGEFSVVAALWNQDNEIMFSYSGYLSALIAPGEKGILRIELPYSLVEAWRDAGEEPTWLDCYGYTTHEAN